MPEGDYTLEAAWSNGPGEKLVTTADKMPLEAGAAFKVGFSDPLELTVRQATTFGDLGTMTFSAGGLAQRVAPATN